MSKWCCSFPPAEQRTEAIGTERCRSGQQKKGDISQEGLAKIWKYATLVDDVQIITNRMFTFNYDDQLFFSITRHPQLSIAVVRP
jgi:hypothetical protein